MRIGVPREIKSDEHRVALTPAGARELVTHGHEVLIEKGAGEGSSMPDEAYRRVGAAIVDDAVELWGSAELVCKVKEPVGPELSWLRADVVLFAFLHLAASLACTRAILASGTTAIAYETVQRPDGSLPLLAPMSEVAGRMAPLVGAAHLMRPGTGRGVLVSGVPGVEPARVVVVGAGIAGTSAAAMAAGLHANVVVMDRDLSRLRALDSLHAGRVRTIAASRHAIEEACLDADLVIGAVLVPGAKAPRIVSTDLVERMREGSVLVDIAVDQGGCFEDTRPTTHAQPVFPVHGSLFYCVANMPGAVPHTSTHALANATLPYLMELANAGWRRAALEDPTLASGLNAAGGALTSAPVGEAHEIESVPCSSVLV